MRQFIVNMLMILSLPLTVSPQRSRLDVVIPGGFRVHDPRTLRSCDMGMPVDEIVRKAELILGFENTRDCPPSAAMRPPMDGGLTFENVSARQALDQLMPLTPGFTWREVSGVVVVRPS